MDFKKISYPFHPKYLNNFFEKSSNLYYPSKIETKVVINIGELPKNEKTVFFDFLEKNQEILRESLLFDYENSKVIFCDYSIFSNCVFKYFLKNPSYLEILDFIDGLSLKYEDIFEKIIKQIQATIIGKERF